MPEAPAARDVTEELLSHLKVIDIATPVALACGRFFASLGADVVRVERDDLAGAKGRDAANCGKRSMVLDYMGDGREAFLDLVRESDVLIESFAPGALAQAGLGYADLAAINPRLIQVSITPFGQTGPYAHYKGGELVVAAMAGTLFQMGEPDDRPVREPGDANFFHACGAGVTGALLAERVREETGRGQLVDISAQEMGAGRSTVAIVMHTLAGIALTRNGQSINTGNGFSRVLWPVADGTVFYMEARPGTPMADDMDQWIGDETGVRPSPSHDMATVERFLASMTGEEAVSRARVRRIRLMTVSSPQDVVADAHLAARGLFVGEDQIPGYFLKALAGGAA